MLLALTGLRSNSHIDANYHEGLIVVIASERKTCGAKTRAGHPCQRAPMPNGRCSKHGGKQPAPGITHPNTVHGRYSKALPARLRANAEAALNDDDLLSMNQAVSVLDARLIDLFGRLEEDAGSKAWLLMRDQLNVVLNYLREDRLAAALGATTDALEIVRSGLAESAMWLDIMSTMEQRRKLVDTEIKRRKEMGNLLTAEQALTMLHNVAFIVRQHVDDDRVVQAIGRELVALAQRGAGQDDDGVGDTVIDVGPA